MPCISFAPALLSSAWISLTCLLAYLLNNLTIIPFWWLWKVWNLFLDRFPKIVFFFYIRIDSLYRYRFLVFVLIPSIGTIFLHSYWSTVSVLFFCIVLYNNGYLLCYHLTHDTCLLSPDTCLQSPDTCRLLLITCHCYITTWLVIIIFQKSCNCYPVLNTVTCISSLYVLL